MEAGFDGFLTKPIDRHSLLASIQAACQASACNRDS